MILRAFQARPNSPPALCRREGNLELRWEFAGGKVEPGETQPQALIRELREELGIDATPGVYIASHQRDVSGRRIHLHAWHVPAFNGLIRALEHQALAWCTPEEALEYPLAPADIPLLQAFMALRDARLTDSC